MPKIRVLLAEDHTILRQGLKQMLELGGAIQVVAEASDGESAVNLARQTEPDVAVIDLGLPRLHGLDAIRQISRLPNPASILVLSMHNDSQMIRDSLQAGANGYLVKESAITELTRAIETVQRGETFLSPEVASIIAREFVSGPTANLTPREVTVLRHLASGSSTNQIAAELHLSPKTIESHRRHIIDKTGIRSIAELTKYAIRAGISDLNQ